MRLRLPDDCAGVSHFGAALTRAPDGTIEADAAAAEALAPHGIVPIDPGEPTGRRPRDRRASDDRRMLR